MTERRRPGLVVVLVFTAALLFASGAAGQDGPVPFAAGDYLHIQQGAALPGIMNPEPTVMDLWVEITGDADTDERIRALAEARGYVRQPVVTAELVPVDGRRLQAPAAEAWVALRAAARDAGHRLELTSAHRGVPRQQSLFRERLRGTSDAGIDATLAQVAPPGYSKHHTGYTIDVRAPDGGGPAFAFTAAYAWLSGDDFAAARAHGWVPSYPDGGVAMGPDPEPWELTWVGPGRIECARAGVLVAGFCDIAGSAHRTDVEWLASIGVTVGCRPERFCPDDPITRGDAASMLWRLFGAPPADPSTPFADVYESDPWGVAVGWLWREGLVTGRTADAFAPTVALTAEEALALLVRLGATEGLPGLTGLSGAAAPPGLPADGVDEVGLSLSRAEFAAILHRWANETR